MERIILASGSLRRRELLEAAGIVFDVLIPDLDETTRDILPPAKRVIALAEDKALAIADIAQASSPRLVLAADTLVCVPDTDQVGGEDALGKPRDADEARSMLKRLSGAEHVVRTGVFLLDRDSGTRYSARSDTSVRFAPLSDAEIEGYLASGEWDGVAGAYRIQGLASLLVDCIDGSWTGVVGLPMHELYVMLRKANFRISSLSGMK
jgi:septum formation protein